MSIKVTRAVDLLYNTQHVDAFVLITSPMASTSSSESDLWSTQQVRRRVIDSLRLLWIQIEVMEFGINGLSGQRTRVGVR